MIRSLAQQCSGSLDLQHQSRFEWQSETEKILSRIDPDRKNLLHDQKNQAGEFNFFEATEKIAVQFDSIALEYRKWRNSVREKISSFGAIGFCENFGGYVIGFRFQKNRMPKNWLGHFEKPFKRIEKQTNLEYWRPRKTSEIYEITRKLRFDLNRKLEKVIGLKKRNEISGRVKIFQIGSAWIVAIEGENILVPKGCNRINTYRLERLSKGATC
jgi:hypothetical protein